MVCPNTTKYLLKGKLHQRLVNMQILPAEPADSAVKEAVVVLLVADEKPLWPQRAQRDVINATSLMVDKFELWYCKNLWVPFTYRNTIKYFLCMDSKDSVMDQNTLY